MSRSPSFWQNLSDGLLCLFAVVLLLLLAVLTTGCQHNPVVSVTSGARTSVSQAAAATGEAQRASERSSAHIRAFKSDAERIDYKSQRALEILDHP